MAKSTSSTSLTRRATSTSATKSPGPSPPAKGALLVVDASQGVEAQTLANAYLAINHGLEVIPVINKIDLPSADIVRTQEMIEQTVGLDATDAIPVSAKTGQGVPDILEAIVNRLPPPKGDAEAPLQALIFDSWFDSYRGVIVLARIVNGRMRKGMRIRLMWNGKVFDVESMGVLTPKPVEIEELSAGEVGFFVATIKNVSDTRVGDTITEDARPAVHALPGFEEIKPMVFAGIYTVDSHEHTLLRDALEKLKLNDSSFFFEPESSVALGFGFRCGFLGLLHMEIIQERLEREFDLDLITTAPSVRYKIHLTDGSIIEVDNPSRWPDPSDIEKVEEPMITADHSHQRRICRRHPQARRRKAWRARRTSSTCPRRSVMLTYELPLNEIVLDFYDRLKSVSRGYASLDYHLSGTWDSPMVKMDILVSGEPVDALSIIVHQDFAYDRGRALVSKMRELIPRQQFEVAIQAAIGAKVIARETVSAMRKNVIAKCYGGDISRKRKLLEKQKEGKKRMKRIGKVDIPQEAFFAVLKVGEDSGR